MLGPGGLNPWTHGSATYAYDELKTRPGYRAGKDREQDVAEAKKLLDAAGFKGLKGALPFSSGTSYETAFATVTVDRLREIGFDFTLKEFTYAQTLVELASRNWGILETKQHANNVDVNEYLEFYFNPDGPRNYGKWRSTKFDELMEKQNATVDPQQRNVVVKEVVKLLEVENPRAAVFMRSYNLAVQDWLHNHYAAADPSQQNGGVPLDRVWRNRK